MLAAAVLLWAGSSHAATGADAGAQAGAQADAQAGGQASAAGENGAADGLIVRLKQASPHRRQDDPRHALRDQARANRVLDAAHRDLPGARRSPALRAVARDQLLLDYGRPLPAAEAEALAQRLRRDPEVVWAVPNRREQRLQMPTDPLVPQQWWMHTAGGADGNALPDRRRGVPGFVSAWQSGLPGADGVVGLGGVRVALSAQGQSAAPPAGVVIAVLDTGLTPHPDLAGRVLPGHDFVSDPVVANDGDGRDADPSDPGDGVAAADLGQPSLAGCGVSPSSWHGTAVAGLLGAVAGNGLGGAGILRGGQVLPVRVAGRCGASVADILDGMRWAAGLPVAGAPPNPHPARIINLSFGGADACGPAYQATIDELRAIGVVVVAAAGNEHGGARRPANCQGVIGVVALNRDGFKTHYSNFGPELAVQGIATVGGDDAQGGAWGSLVADGGLVTTWNRGSAGPGTADYAGVFGTSFAAPLVAGTLGLMLSVNPGLDAAQLLEGLRRSARPHVLSAHIGTCSAANPGRCLCNTAQCGAGILDAEQALRYADNPAAYVPPSRTPALLDSPELARAYALGADRPPNIAATTSTASATAGTAGTSGMSQAAGSASGGAGALAPGWLLALGMGIAVLLWLRLTRRAWVRDGAAATSDRRDRRS